MFPEKFLERMEQMLGEEYPEFVQSYEKESCHALRVNDLKSNSVLLKEQLGIELTPVPWTANGFYYKDTERPGRHPYHDAGVYYIQEASAMSPVVYLEPQPGERILDLCAAPGGKSTQIAIEMKNQGILVCNEIHPARAKILSENVERMGIRNALVTNETPQKLEASFPLYFDRILVDAPCSGEGMFRKNQEAQQEWSLDNVEFCGERQDEILECAANMLKPDGRLVYSTCTFAPTENEGSISRFLKKHPEFEIVLVEKFSGMESGKSEWCQIPCEGIEYTIRLWPHKLQGEGHYVAVLHKKPEAEVIEETGKCTKDKGKNKKNGKMQKEPEYKECRGFLTENIKESLQGKLISFGEQLYLVPEDMVSLDKLRVLRVGLHLGTCKKNRFEPSHALALAMKPENVKNVWNLSSNCEKVEDYLKGNTLSADGEKGWYLITVDGYSIGWGKLSGQVMKNHYPKGLRRM